MLLIASRAWQKASKNRLHLDLRPADQAAEVARLERLGASRTDVGQGSDVSWVVMADPDGNEFSACYCASVAFGAPGAATMLSLVMSTAASAGW